MVIQYAEDGSVPSQELIRRMSKYFSDPVSGENAYFLPNWMTLGAPSASHLGGLRQRLLNRCSLLWEQRRSHEFNEALAVMLRWMSLCCLSPEAVGCNEGQVLPIGKEEMHLVSTRSNLHITSLRLLKLAGIGVEAEGISNLKSEIDKLFDHLVPNAGPQESVKLLGDVQARLAVLSEEALGLD
jgi:hypothetical protein